MNQAPTSSKIVCEAMGLSPDGIPAEKEGLCAFCGAQIDEGDPHVPFSVGPGFMDDLSLAARGSDMTCGCCAQLMSADALRNTGYGVFSLAGVTPFRKWVEVASAIIEPPEPPFVMVYATANNQHMAWRAPVNHSREMFYVRVGLRDLKIRRKILIAAIKACENVAIGLERNQKAGQKTLPNPFAMLSSNLKDFDHANLRWAISKVHENEEFQHLLDDEGFMKDLVHLTGLTLGETWALRFVLTPNAGSKNEEE